MTLHKQIKRILSSCHQDNILKDMGYRSLPTGRKTLQAFIKSKSVYVWIKDGRYDFRFDSQSFLLALGKALDFPIKTIEDEINKARERIDILSKMLEPTIFVDTNFKRKNEPIFVLAFMSGKRYIYVSREQLVNKTTEEVLKIITLMVKKHYKTTNGKLPLWGKIKTYIYHHTNGEKFLFAPDGTLLPYKKIPEPRAELKIKNQLIGG